MKKVVLAVLVLLVLALSGLVAYVAMMDWNQHKAEIANQISELTGKKVVLQGNVSMSILPSPTLSAENVLLYNNEGDYSTKPLAEIKKVEAKVSLGVLFSNSFDVQRIALKEPKLVFEVDKERRLNWFGNKKNNEAKEAVDVSLDSLTFEKATVRFIEQNNEIDTTVENLNAEVIAQTVTGPYRIEGSYTKGDQPEGFAVSLGKIVEGMATSVNFVVNYPATKSYVRFDGTVFLENSNVLGSAVIESEQPADWVNSLQDEVKVALDYNQPLAVSADINTNVSKIDLSNVVVKYGKTSGAGNVLIPLLTPEMKEQKLRPKIEFAFDMTDLDLEPAALWLEKWGEKYKNGAPYQPESNFDIIGDIKAIKTYYRGETLRDMSLSFDWTDNSLLVRELKAGLLKDSTLSLKGNLAAKEARPQYNAEVEFATGEFDKLLAWAGVEVNPTAPATYQKAIGKATLSGNLQQLQVSPYELTLDKSVFRGDAGFVLATPLKSFIVVNVDSINLDNYLPPLATNESKDVFLRRVLSRLHDSATLSKLDMRLMMKANLAIVENLPLENVDVALNLANGALQVERFEVGNAANAKVSLKGGLSGIGGKPVVDNLSYSVSTQDFRAMCNKLELSLPDANWQALKRFAASGMLRGNFDKFDLSSNAQLENMDIRYRGNIDVTGDTPRVDGRLELKAPDFVKMLNNFNIKYTPRAFSLGLFSLNANVSGVWNNIQLVNADMNIGSNVFAGQAIWDRTTGRNNFMVKAKINKFEFDQFGSDTQAENRVSFQDGGSKAVEFLRKPYWAKDRIDYAFMSSFDMSGEFELDTMTWQGQKFDGAKFELKLVNGKLDISNFVAKYNGGGLSGKVTLQAAAAPEISGEIKLTNQPVQKAMLVGKKYGLEDGSANLEVAWSSSAVSEEAFMQALKANVKFELINPIVKGWNLNAILADLTKRSQGEGVAEKVQSLLQSGRTNFDSFKGVLSIDKDRYSVQDAVFVAKNYKVAMKAEGNVAAWDGKADFNVTWEDANAKIPGYGFEMSGSLESPALTVDVAKIQNLFQEMQAKKEAEQKAREQARLNNLKQMMATQQTRAVLLRRKINDEILPLYKQRKELVSDEQAQKDLGVINDSIQKQLKILDDVNTLAMTPEFDEAFVKKLEKDNDGVENVSAMYAVAIDDVYKAGLMREIKQMGDVNDKTHTNIKSEYDKYLEDFKQFGKRLEKVGSVLQLDKTATIVNLKVSAENSMKSVDAMSANVNKIVSSANETDDVKALETIKKDVADKQKAIQEVGSNMQKTLGALFKEAEKLVRAEEEWFEAREKTAAREKKVAENTSKISVDATGKTTTFVPDIEELEKAEKEVKEENIPVLDFSGKVRRDDTPVKSVEKAPKSGLITESDGSRVDTGGKISRD